MYSIYMPQSKIDGFPRKENRQEEWKYNLTSLTGFNRINIFIGGNNTGKSRFLRDIFLHTDRLFRITDENGFESWLRGSSANSIRNGLRLFYTGNTEDRLENYKKAFYHFLDNYYLSPPVEQKTGPIKSLYDSIYYLFNNTRNEEVERFSGNKKYIPLLRGLNPLYREEGQKNYKYRDMYCDRTCTQYFKSDPSISEEVFTGQSIYFKLQQMLLGEQSDREKVKQYEHFLSSNIFEGREITLIPKIQSDTVWVRIEGEEDEREIHNLGDGIQSLIILTFPIFIYSDQSMMFFIEEPEINMHPGMQKIFLKTLQNESFNNHQYFFTTHSNHFVDLAFDYNNISIFMFKKFNYGLNGQDKLGFLIEKAESGNIEILKQLGVNNSSVFLSNCTIWIEGITDRLYMREYINREITRRKEENKSYEDYTENLHFSFIEYGGSSISHLSCIDNIDEPEDINIKRICNKPIIIADFDRDGKHIERKRKLGKCYYYIEGVKEIENTLHEEVLKRIIAEYERKSFKNLQFTKPNQFKQEEYKNKPLGKFIDKQLGANKNRNCSYADGNTINYKQAFAEKACKFIKDPNKKYNEVMSSSAKELAGILVDFIEESNRNTSAL